MNYQTLATELALPAYTGLTDQQAADALNARNISVDVEGATGADILEATVPAEYNALAAAQKDVWLAMIVMPSLHLDGANTRLFLANMFGQGTQTRANLIAMQSGLMSRATQIGLGVVLPGHVQMVREGRPF